MFWGDSLKDLELEYLKSEYPIGSILTLSNISDNIPNNLQIFEWRFIRAVGKYKYYERIS